MPGEVIRSLALVKWAAAQTSKELVVQPQIADAIAQSALRIYNGEIEARHFPFPSFRRGQVRRPT